ncbi:MAG: hypothetical protein KDN19_10870 [Verrucomicrobiae bacterium]|nr:hypothetical protein [Verrucomicrobiae bacterium]
MFHRNPARAQSHGGGLSVPGVLIRVGLLAATCGVLPSESVLSADENDGRLAEAEAARELREAGVRVFLDLKTGRVSEVNLDDFDGNLDDFDGNLKGALKKAATFSELTDLSLEATAVDDGMIPVIANLKKLEWLNLYRTRISDAGFRAILSLPSLTHLPAGETKITDGGLADLNRAEKLRYLGLRGTAVSDRGAASIAKCEGLTGLHLGATRITDDALPLLRDGLPNLQELWLHDTAVTDAGLEVLKGFSRLRKLYLQRTRTTVTGVAALRRALPDCDIYWESDPKP